MMSVWDNGEYIDTWMPAHKRIESNFRSVPYTSVSFLYIQMQATLYWVQKYIEHPVSTTYMLSTKEAISFLSFHEIWESELACVMSLQWLEENPKSEPNPTLSSSWWKGLLREQRGVEFEGKETGNIVYTLCLHMKLE